MLKNILVPLDGSQLAEAALPFARALASRAGGSLILVRAAQNRSPLGDITYAPVIDGYSGFPIDTRPEHGPTHGTIEWLLQAVERHALAEQDALHQYEYVGTASGDPVIALLMRLILEDEERHHGLLRRIEASLRDALNWTHSPNALPTTGAPQPPVAYASRLTLSVTSFWNWRLSC